MAIDPRQLRPTGLVRLLNSTPLGEVISERQLLRHRSRAGFRIGDDRHVDLLRYVAWLVAFRHEPRSEPGGDPYKALKEHARARNAVVLAVPPAWTSMHIEACRGEPPWESGIKSGLRTSRPPG